MASTTNLTDIAKKFVGISTLKFSNSPTGDIATIEWDYIVPIVRDSLSFNPSDVTFNNSYIHGQRTPYTSVLGEGSEIPLSFNVPTIDDTTLAWLLKKVETVKTVSAGSTGSYKCTGVKLSEPKIIKGTAMIISEDEQYCMIIRNLKGAAVPIMDNISTTPIAFKVSTVLQSISDDAEGEVYFGTYEAGA